MYLDLYLSLYLCEPDMFARLISRLTRTDAFRGADAARWLSSAFA